MRNRVISQQAAYNGTACVGNNTDTHSCNDNVCPPGKFKFQSYKCRRAYCNVFLVSIVDCTWHTWGAWDTCSVSCGGGTQERNRTKAAAQHGGADCVGNEKGTQPCSDFPCPGKFKFQSCREEQACSNIFGVHSGLYLG